MVVFYLLKYLLEAAIELTSARWEGKASRLQHMSIPLEKSV
jgi:hypothetical protein